VLGVPHLSLPWSDLHLVGVPLRTLLKGADNGGCLKMAVGQQILLTSFARAINHAAEDELEENVLQEVMPTTLKEQLLPPCLDDVPDYISPIEKEVEFQDLEQEINHETPPVELK
jgi:hypothetical protein